MVDHVIDASLLALVFSQDSIEAAIVPITQGQKAFWCTCVAPSAKWGDEGGEVAIRFTQGDAVVAIPGVHHCLPCVLRDLTCKVKRGLHGKCFSLAELVQW